MDGDVASGQLPESRKDTGPANNIHKHFVVERTSHSKLVSWAGLYYKWTRLMNYDGMAKDAAGDHILESSSDYALVLQCFFLEISSIRMIECCHFLN